MSLWKRLFTPSQDGTPSQRGGPVSSWDVVVLSFKLLFQQVQFWIRPNLWLVLLSLPVITAPAAKAGMYQTVAAGLRDPALAQTKPRQEMKEGFFKHMWRAFGLALIKWLLLAIIVVSIFFWIQQDTWLLRSISIISIYVFVIWWLSVGFLYPILVDNPEASIAQVFRQGALLAFQKPFESLLFAVVSSLLHALGLFLLGPILLVVPVLRSILHLHAYWYLTGQVIPGFMDLVEYTEKFYD